MADQLKKVTERPSRIRLVFISDTHNRWPMPEIPPGDILIHSGDATGGGRIQEIIDFNAWMAELPHPVKIFIPGNHDFLFEKDLRIARTLVPSAVCLVDEEFQFHGLRIWGSPWQPRFFDWAFNLDRGKKISEKWDLIPEGIHVLVTHGPPAGILDQNARGESVGCLDLRVKIETMTPPPLIHAFGHIHEARGIANESSGTLFINASICNLRYQAVNKPVVVNLECLPTSDDWLVTLVEG